MHDSETGEVVSAAAPPPLIFQVDPRNGRFKQMIGIERSVEAILQSDKNPVATPELQADIARRVEAEARDIWVSLAEAWLTATKPFFPDKEDRSTLVRALAALSLRR